MKTFTEYFKNLSGEFLERSAGSVETATEKDVLSTLEKIPLSGHGFLALLSSAADSHSEKIEQAARNLTAQRFGKIVNLYIPLYLTNSCINNCLYCGFGKDQKITRKTLDTKEINREGERLLREGYRSVLLVAGEDFTGEAPVDYLAEAIETLKKSGFVFVGIEAGPMTEDEYRYLGQRGLDSVTIYQETYDRATYEKVHPTGPKKNFEYRLQTPERAARAGIRAINIGFLLGLSDFVKEAIVLATHVKYLQKTFWQTSFGVSFPRIHSAPEGFVPPHPVADAELVRLIMAMRLFNPDIILTLSTREAPKLRDRLFGAGVNQVSAGSKTSPGAYTVKNNSAAEQFAVVDDRTPTEVMEAINGHGYESVFKDWDPALRPVSKKYAVAE